MATFITPIEIAGPDGERFETVNALAGTRTTFTTLPSSTLRSLGVTPMDEREVKLANGERIRRDIGQTPVRIDGSVRTTIVVFSDEGSVPLLGVVTLEEFGLGVDPVDLRLVPVPAIGIRA